MRAWELGFEEESEKAEVFCGVMRSRDVERWRFDSGDISMSGGGVAI